MEPGLLLTILGGAGLAAPYVLWLARRSTWRLWSAVGLVVAAFLYLPFAGMVGAPEALPLELGGVAAFGTLAALGLGHSPWWLAFGWGTHVAWDLALHPLDGSGSAPGWYPALCLGFDLLTAGAMLILAQREAVGRSPEPTP